MRSLQHVNQSYKHDEEQIDFYATVNEDKTPHITMLTSLHIYDENTLIWGEYSAGRSKHNQQERRKIGFLSVINGKETVSGKADFIGSEKSGEKLDALNQIPEFRYNNVNGYSPAHILRKKSMYESGLDREAYARAREESEKAIKKAGEGSNPEAISVLTRNYMDAENGFKVLAYVGGDGYPTVLPVPQALLTPSNRAVFSMEYDAALQEIAEGAAVAIYAIEYPSMCAVLVSGTLEKKDIDGRTYGIVDITRVYNPMLSVAGYIYPPQEIKTVTEFCDTVYEYNV